MIPLTHCQLSRYSYTWKLEPPVLVLKFLNDSRISRLSNTIGRRLLSPVLNISLRRDEATNVGVRLFELRQSPEIEV